MGSTGRRSYDTAVSGQVQSDIAEIVAQLESVIGSRSQSVGRAMADFQADGVSEQYAAAEQRWNRAAQEVRAIIALVRTTLARNDDSADQALSRARSAVSALG